MTLAFDFEETPVLETKRLRLRRILPSDLAAWAEIWQCASVRRYLLEFEGSPDDSAVWSIMEWAERIFNRKTGIRWAITLKPKDRMIGSCGFHLYEAHHSRLEIGYELHNAYWRRGIMTEAVAAVLRFCFDCLHVHRVEADVTEGNVASAALLRKLGFVLEGFWRERVYSRGAYHGMWQFGLLEPEYRGHAGAERSDFQRRHFE
ncbi:MAG: GNAT family N-acetyltransferase [Chloroflexota bacterium]|nr:GNAT family N-acetyltransferase [Chloroflexota bacterium]